MQKELVLQFVSLIILIWTLVNQYSQLSSSVFPFTSYPLVEANYEANVLAGQPSWLTSSQRSWGLTFCQYSGYVIETYMSCNHNNNSLTKLLLQMSSERVASIMFQSAWRLRNYYPTETTPMHCAIDPFLGFYYWSPIFLALLSIVQTALYPKGGKTPSEL